MGLWCSLLGHTFDETDVEEEREDRGSEVVTVIRELERCSRCGAERVVSENKEVTSVVEAEEAGVEDDPAPGANGAAAGGTAGPGAVDRDGAFTGEALEGSRDPEEEDAEILTDESEAREPGQWPDEDGEPDATGGSRDGGADEPAGGAGDDILDAGAGEGAGDEPAFEPTESSSTVPEGTYECPECGFTVDADSSFRAGDACPECQEGYLEERNR